MDHLHFTHAGITSYDDALAKANAIAQSFYGDRGYDLEIEVTAANVTVIPPQWKIEVTAALWDLDE